MIRQQIINSPPKYVLQSVRIITKTEQAISYKVQVRSSKHQQYLLNMSNRKDLIRMKWRDDDTIRFYRDTPDKRGVSELVINNVCGVAYTIISGNVANVLIPL